MRFDVRRMIGFICALQLISAFGCGRNPYSHSYIHPAAPRYSSAPFMSPAAHARQGRFKAVSYNIKHSYNTDQAVEMLQNDTSLQEADVMCLQEMDLDSVRLIADTFQYGFVYYPSVRHPLTGRDFGNAILSKWPMRNDSKMVLPRLQKKQMQRIAVGATIQMGGEEVYVYCVHKEVLMLPDQREEQARLLIDSVPADAEHVIIAGDFNTYTGRSRHLVEDVFVDSGFDIATENVDWTYNHWYLLNKKSKMDHIFVKNLHVVGSGVVPDRSASDHMPIWTEFTFQENQVARRPVSHEVR